MSWHREWRIERATQAVVRRHAGALVALDDKLRAEFGGMYSDEPWTAKAFMAQRPGKWVLSRLAFEGDRPCGFWIASHTGGQAHTHRVGIGASSRGQGLLHALAEEVHRAAREAGARRMTLYVKPENQIASRAYRRIGYRPCELGGRAAMERLLCA
jgi:ribosomal protein S18 acetylase RimI-like enzyme